VTHDAWVKRDAAVVWHGFTQMAAYADNHPIVVERAEGHELIDVDGRRYLYPSSTTPFARSSSTEPTRRCSATGTAS
jgi:adenosylmethionine-8-amino-7-oxononanoate aminotransferase